MLSFIINRLFNSVFLIIFISFLSFGIMKLDFTIPEIKFLNLSETHIETGDPLADLRLNPAISEEKILAEEKRLGLNKPFLSQYFTWFSNILRGDFGYTQSNQRVIDRIKDPLINTLLLNLCAIACTWFIAIPLGIWAALKQNKFIDKFFQLLTSSFMSLPSFVLAIFLLIFALNTGLFPIGGKHLALPVLVLVIMGLSSIQRQMRGNLLDVLREDYVRTARAKGLAENKVIYRHALRNAINPLITILGYEFSNLFAGSALVEMVLAYPGLGNLTLEAARKLDINMVMANLLLASVMLVLGNFLADILLMRVDPRIRAEGK
jgi:peptide/nickel transport system permease protein